MTLPSWNSGNGFAFASSLQLLDGDWETTGPLRVDTTLGADEIGEPEFLHNAVAFLTMLEGDERLGHGRVELRSRLPLDLGELVPYRLQFFGAGFDRRVGRFTM